MSHLPISLALAISIVAGVSVFCGITGAKTRAAVEDAQANCAIPLRFEGSGRCFRTLDWENIP